MADTQKLYCYVDETGQDTEGKFFIVVVVASEADLLESTDEKLKKIEEQSGKKIYKWGKTPKMAKIKYFQEVGQINYLGNSIYFSVYRGNVEYTPLVSLTIAKSVLAKKHGENQLVRIIIDGLNDREKEKVSKELKKLKIKYDKIRGMADEQSSFLRLADATAGVLRDSLEDQDLAKKIVKTLRTQKILQEI